ncbi:MAG: glycogen debranching protein GlgX [Candidatus Latescibacteria bacterium]|nr:glycogen debranching protein GlgX [Candidatus Latescibacterota bacterium]NIM22422.1 glycogen debranching protein GlgX [Candidatus Latescibacterota bacterium]NIM64782.1 glycogen debranching protein GlgX [Candidatus Latescibacterota bacterium]NIO01293.1 glycogen debranching protein GlgX [Candidatus Latescibacterota bacterium]NIO27785.1 glycogen debranching protein GlgX [Candidatus Latescibacterota bacterium]
MKISRGRPYPLGSAYDGGGTNFSVFSSIAQKVEVCFFDDNHNERRFELPGQHGSVWHGYFESIAPGQRYGFRVHGPWDPAEGHLCNPQKLLLDPYGKAVDGSVTWDDSLFPLDPENPASPVNNEDTAPFVPKSVVVDTVFDWQNGAPLRMRLEDTVIYEVHVKGFTIRHPEIPPELRGTYAALAHPASIEHLMRLGVTAVELLPIQQFVHRRRLADLGLRNYWGYDPICLFAPHNEYASDQSPGGAVNEFKEMIRSFHAVGIEVIMDVVFNHTAEGGSNGPILGFKGLDNSTYYRLKPGNRIEHIDYTGTRNTLRTDHTQVRQLILDSLRYWATEMQVDGFRFDLAPVLAREGDAIDFENAFFTAVRRDPALSRVKLIAEPWDLRDDGYQLGRFPAEWSEWNDKYRDDIRDFWGGRGGAAGRFAMRFAGSPDIFATGEKPPQVSVNMVTCHDGFTLHDLVSYETKHNEANGEGNSDGHDDNRSWNCGVEGPSDDADINALRARQKRNFLATLLLSHGVPMLLGGDELGRTQRGNNNAYCQDNEMSWFDWEGADQELLEFVSFLTRLRKQHAITNQRAWPHPGGSGAKEPLTHVWYDAGGSEIQTAGLENSDPQPLQVLISARFEEKANSGETTSVDDMLVMFNPTEIEATFQIPDSSPSDPWHAVLDTAPSVQPGPVRTAQAGEMVTSIPHSLIVWVRRA